MKSQRRAADCASQERRPEVRCDKKEQENTECGD